MHTSNACILSISTVNNFLNAETPHSVRRLNFNAIRTRSSAFFDEVSSRPVNRSAPRLYPLFNSLFIASAMWMCTLEG